MSILRNSLLTFLCSLALWSWAQPFRWPAEYAPTVNQGGTINVTIFGDITTLNPVLMSSATETSLIRSQISTPSLLYRDWLGSISYQTDGEWNMLWAANVEEVIPNIEYIVTLKEGWKWSDGEIIDVDDVIAAQTIIADKEVESNRFGCTHVDNEPVQIEKLGQYQYRVKLPKAVVNALASAYCGTVPEHIYMPIYQAEGAAGIKALWGVDADVSTMVSGGPYVIKEFKAGERIVYERNPYYGEFVQAADGLPLPGPEGLVVTMVEDKNAQLARVITGQADYYYPTSIDELASINDALQKGAISGSLYANISPGKRVDFISYNFNHTDVCKATMFRDVRFRQAISTMIDRQRLVDTALGGLGVPSRGVVSTAAAAPFDAPFLKNFEFDMDAGLELLNQMGFSDYDSDGVLVNPDTGCRVEFDLQYNSGNNRRSQEAAVISQTLKDFGVKINPREVSSDIWLKSIKGDLDYDLTGQRSVDYDSQIWALVGGDVDSPTLSNAFGLQANLNSWNKSKVDIEPWEILLDRLTKQMDQTLVLEERVRVYEQRVNIMRQYLPVTPLISPGFHFYTNLSNVWPLEKMNAYSIEAPYRPGNFMALLMK